MMTERRSANVLTVTETPIDAPMLAPNDSVSALTAALSCAVLRVADGFSSTYTQPVV